MSPIELLCFVVTLTAGTAGVYGIIERRRRRALKELAARWQMHFSPRDPFRLASRIAPKLSIPGAASVRLRDLIYGIEGDFYRYYFTVEYTLHAISARTRIQRVATFLEPRACSDPRMTTPPALCESELRTPIIEQYLRLKERADTSVSRENQVPTSADRDLKLPFALGMQT